MIDSPSVKRHDIPLKDRRRGFSLIELLVVISIVSLLVAILLPALSAARLTAQGAVCLSNQRQLGIGFNAYAAENGDWMPDGAGRNYIGAANLTSQWSSPWDPTGNGHEPAWTRVIAKMIDQPYTTDQVVAGLYEPSHWKGGDAIDGAASVKDNGFFQCPVETQIGVNYAGGNNSSSYAHNNGIHGNPAMGVEGMGLGFSDSYFNHRLANFRERGRPVQFSRMARLSSGAKMRLRVRLPAASGSIAGRIRVQAFAPPS